MNHFSISLYISSKRLVRRIKTRLGVIRQLVRIHIYQAIRTRPTDVIMTSTIPTNTATIHGACGVIRVT